MRKLFLLSVMSAAVAVGAACSSSTNGAQSDDSCSNCSGDDSAPAKDGGTDATLDGSSCPVQSYPVNSAACPTTYSTSYADQLCSPAGTQCWYPGAGDIGTNGCASAATLLCEFPDSGLGGIPDAAIFDDAGDAGDASLGYWVFGQ